MISADEFKDLDVKNKAFVETSPPIGGARNIAEFERNQGVIISYVVTEYFGEYYVEGFKVPVSLIEELSEDVLVYILCPDEFQSNAASDLSAGSVNEDNIIYVDLMTDSEWARDYSPWFIEYDVDRCVGIVDFPYNRPQRVNDDEVPIALGTYFNLEVFGMDLEHTGGNYMTDGMGTAASCDLVYEENPDLNISEVGNLVFDYMGIDNYHLVTDPLDDYIEHIDCWGKFLDVDKMLVASVPASDSRYADFEAMADYWSNQITPYGNNYQVYRTAWEVPNNAYTNSLIMNDKVFIPFNTGTAGDYNAAAAEVYEQAMPGYEIIGISYNSWYSTDALHCRTHEVPDMEMLRIVHFPTLGNVEYQETYEFSAEVYTFNSTEIISSVDLFYSVNGAEYVELPMILQNDNTYAVSIDCFNPEETISYYIKATNSAPKTETHPFIGSLDPHIFTIGSATNSIQHANTPYIKAFPNPASNNLYLITNNLPEGEYECSIFDQQGKLVMEISKDLYSNEWNLRQIDISKFNAGLYYVKAFAGDKYFTSKFIKL